MYYVAGGKSVDHSSLSGQRIFNAINCLCKYFFEMGLRITSEALRIFIFSLLRSTANE